MKFEIGNRVQSTETYHEKFTNGKAFTRYTGTIIALAGDDSPVGKVIFPYMVEFDEEKSFGIYGYFFEYELELVYV